MKRILSIYALILATGNIVKAQVPVINSFSPTTGLVGSTVTISGSGFDGTSPAKNQVFFGSAQATVLTASFGTLTVAVPAGSTTNLISVRNATSGLIGYSRNHFNGIFCNTPLDATTYNSFNQQLGGVNGAYNIDIYDMDGDGKSDIITGNGGITIARNQSVVGTMNFVAFNINTSATVQQFFVADFDGDGKRDIAISGSNGAFIFPNLSTPGNLVFGSRVTINASRQYYQCAAGDLNNDGKIDFVGGGNDGTNQLYTFRNTSTGPGNFGFAANTVLANVGCLTRGLQCVDLDGDGVSDIAGTTWDCQTMYALRNTTTALNTTFSFATRQTFSCPGYPYRMKLGDFDKDGRIDLVTPLYNSSQTGIFRNTSTIGTINFAPLITLSAVIQNYRVGVGDVNGDGFPDIVTKPNGVGTIFQVYKNTSSGPGTVSFAAPITYSSSAGSEVGGIAIGDMDGDLVPDIATSGTSSNVIRFHRNTSSQLDNTPPTAACKSITVALGTNGTVNVTGAMIDNGSGDGCGLAPLKINGQTSLSYTCADIGPHTVTLNVSDLAGNTATCTSVVTVAPAVIIVSGQTTVCQGQTVLLTANTADSYQWQKDGIDISGATNQTYNATETGDYTVSVVNTGGCSGTSAATHVTVNNNPTVSVTPNTNVFLCPPGNTATLTASLSSIYQWMKGGVNILGANLQSYTATTTGSYSVQVTDLFGCAATSAPIVVSANPPEIDISGNSNSILNGDNTPFTADGTDFGTTYPATAVVKTFSISNTGISPLDISSIAISGADASNFSIAGISLPAVINSGGSATFTVTFLGSAIQPYNAQVTVLNDDCDEAVYTYSIKAEISCVPPSFTGCPGNISVVNDPGVCGAAVNFNAVAAGIPAPVVTYSHAPGSVFPVGTTTVTATATSSCGSATCNFNVTVRDGENPVITCPAAISVGNDPGRCSANVAITDATATDNCPGVTVVGVRSDGAALTDPYPKGVTTITWTATDASGNTASCSQTVTVRDTENPVITCGSNISVPNDPGRCGAKVVYPAITATDNCSNCSAPVSIPGYNYYGSFGGHTYFTSTAVVSWPVAEAAAAALGGHLATVTSAAENAFLSNSNLYWIGLTDQVTEGVFKWVTGEPLGFTGWGPGEPNNSGNEDWVEINRGGPGRWNDLPAGFPRAYYVEFDCMTIKQTAGLPSGSIFPVGTTTNTFEVTDAAGNTATCSFDVTVTDAENPVITCPSAISVNNDAGKCGATVAITDATATDNCPGVTVAGVRSDAAALTDDYPVGTTTITWTATDAHGNSVTCDQTITVTDNENPVANCKAVTITLVNGSASITAASVNDNSTDNCGIATWAVSKTSFNCSNIGNNTVTLTVTDIHGNVSTCTAVVTVVGEIPTCSVASIPANNTYTGGVPTNLYIGYGPQSTTLQVSAPASGAPYTYSWSGGTLSNYNTGNPVFTATAAGTYTFTVLVTNKYGCTTTCSITICVTDIRVPGTDGKKVYVCHIPPGNPANPQTLSISVNAVPAHVGLHGGDRLGTCTMVPCTAAPVSNFVREEEGVPMVKGLVVTASPNPTMYQWTLQLRSNVETPVSIRILNAQGQAVDGINKVNPNSSISFGGNLRSGVYMAEVMQGRIRQMIKLVKGN